MRKKTKQITNNTDENQIYSTHCVCEHLRSKIKSIHNFDTNTVQNESIIIRTAKLKKCSGEETTRLHIRVQNSNGFYFRSEVLMFIYTVHDEFLL